MNTPEAASPTEKTSNTILLIEDNEDAIELMARAVRKVDASLQLVVVNSAEEATAAFNGTGRYERDTKAPFLVFFDLKIPGSHGLHLLQRFRENPVTRKAALVVLSASATRDELALLNGPQSPADAFLIKPITSAQMAQLIERYRSRAGG